MEKGKLRKAQTFLIENEENKGLENAYLLNEITEPSENSEKRKQKFLLEGIASKPKRIMTTDYSIMKEVCATFKLKNENSIKETQKKSQLYYENFNSLVQI